MGIDYNTIEEFPPDDTGYGFDTIADVLTVSPLLLEKYMQAAEKIVTEAVPTVSKLVATKTADAADFRTKDGAPAPRPAYLLQGGDGFVERPGRAGAVLTG